MKIKEIKVNNITEPLGYALGTPVFTYAAEEDGEAALVQSASVFIRDDQVPPVVVYESGERTDLAGGGIPAEGVALKPRKRYYANLCLTDADGNMALGATELETGKMEEPWKAVWIGPAKSAASAVLTRKFYVNDPWRARLYICGLDLFECFLNGQRVGDEYLSAGFDADRGCLETRTYDVEDYLVEGENEIKISLGQSASACWPAMEWGGAAVEALPGQDTALAGPDDKGTAVEGLPGQGAALAGPDHEDAAIETLPGQTFDLGHPDSKDGGSDAIGSRLCLIAELYTAGHLVLKTDDTWEEETSYVTFPNHEGSEVHDLAGEGGKYQGYVSLPSGMSGQLPVDRTSFPLKKQRALSVKEWLVTPKGETLLDFGQKVTGWTEFNGQMVPAGLTLKLTALESLTGDEPDREDTSSGRQTFVYISDGQPRRVRPRFTQFSFRFMKLELLKGKTPLDPDSFLSAGDFKAWFIGK